MFLCTIKRKNFAFALTIWVSQFYKYLDKLIPKNRLKEYKYLLYSTYIQRRLQGSHIKSTRRHSRHTRKSSGHSLLLFVTHAVKYSFLFFQL